jgi:hypothetical protein
MLAGRHIQQFRQPGLTDRLLSGLLFAGWRVNTTMEIPQLTCFYLLKQ